jgi:hypothetical protein
MSTSINKYKIYCNTEAVYVYGWKETTPTTCFNNVAHSVNTNSVQLLDTISSSYVNVKEDKVNVQRNTWVEDIPITSIAPNSSKTVTFTFPITVSLYSFMIVPDSTHKMDQFSIIANENTTMGLIGADVSIGATSLIAPAAFLTYGYIGFYGVLTNGTNTDDIGRILTIDKNTGIITFETATTHAFSASNTLFKMTIKVLSEMYICGPGVYRFFDDVIGGAPIPAGTVAKFVYKNNDPLIGGVTKDFVVYMECLY